MNLECLCVKAGRHGRKGLWPGHKASMWGAEGATLQSGGSALPTRRRLALQWRIEKKRILARVAKG